MDGLREAVKGNRAPSAEGKPIRDQIKRSSEATLGAGVQAS